MQMKLFIYQIGVHMSDFLKKFSKEAYQDIKKPKISEETERIEENKQPDVVNLNGKEIIKEDKEVENKIDVKEAKKQDRERKDNKTFFKTSNVKEEVYVRDDEKINKRKKKMIVISVCMVVFLVISFIVFYKSNEVSMPQFVKEKAINEVQVWATKNNMELDYTSKYSVEVDEGYIIKQSIKRNTKIQKGSSLNVVVSKGADPEEHIKVPDFMGMSFTEIEAWKKKVKASNVKIEKVFSEEVEKGKTIRFEYKTEGIDASNYRRKDKINVVVSKGKETYEKNIEMPNFKDKSKMEVESWASENEIDVEFIEEASNKVLEGNVISQDIAPKTKIAKKDHVKIVVSRGKIAYAPNFYGLDETQGQMEASKAEVAINSLYYYSDTVRSSYLISQSLPAGTEIKDQVIVLIYSLGKPYINNYDGENVYTMIQAIDEMNKSGAKLTYEMVEVANAEKKGTIVSSNYKASFVNVGTHIVISVANGK